MKKLLLAARVAAVFLLALPAAPAQRFVSGQAADVVLGQPSFTATAFSPTTGARFHQPNAAAVDPTTGKVFVADYNNSRVLRFSSAAAAQIGAFPEAVFGQPSFGGDLANWSGTPNGDTLAGPQGLTVDAQGRLWIADTGNHRVLMFQSASLLGPTRPFADRVLGQPNFSTVMAATTATRMSSPLAVHVGPGDTLWVAEYNNRRVLRFDDISTIANGADADGVLGQPNFTTSSFGLTAAKMGRASGVTTDAAGRLWVVDNENRRVLRFDNAGAKLDGANADGVVGQPDFTTATTSLTAGRFANPFSAFVDAAGALWVSDLDYRRVQRFPGAAAIATNGTADLVLGQPNFTTNALGPASARALLGPIGVAPGPRGSVLVADSSGNRVLRFSLIPKATFTARAALTTTAPSVIVAGTAANATAVQVKVGKAAFKPASLVGPRWTYRAKLKPGRNVLLVRALGPGGDAPTKRLVVTRR